MGHEIITFFILFRTLRVEQQDWDLARYFLCKCRICVKLVPENWAVSLIREKVHYVGCDIAEL